MYDGYRRADGNRVSGKLTKLVGGGRGGLLERPSVPQWQQPRVKDEVAVAVPPTPCSQLMKSCGWLAAPTLQAGYSSQIWWKLITLKLEPVVNQRGVLEGPGDCVFTHASQFPAV